ncbi:MAG TPA: LysR family transcriptional regulator, partial [Streptomyces sp.]|nr:LysR family transcriptional regulator [Streptomyces sp.]
MTQPGFGEHSGLGEHPGSGGATGAGGPSGAASSSAYGPGSGPGDALGPAPGPEGGRSAAPSPDAPENHPGSGDLPPLAHRVPDLGSMELLLAVARLGSLGRAARELGITQPAASSRIRSMERRLGVALVDRSPRGSRLTDAGALVTDWARQVVEAAEAFDAGAQALRGRRD